MNSKGRKAVGIATLVAGAGLIICALFSTWIFIIYGISLFVLGVVIFFNKGEDRIEERKDLNKSKSKKTKR